MRLYINIDHIATVQQARLTDEPDPVRAAVLVELGGADGITVHHRQDARHISLRDLKLLMQTARTGVNLEISTHERMVELAERLRPMQVTLVPEKREEITTEGGLDLGSAAVERSVGRALERLHAAGIRCSLFIDPDAKAVRRTHTLGADAVELHTGEYANATESEGRARELGRLASCGADAAAAGLAVHAGHGLTYENVVPVAALDSIEELNIGHSVISRALFIGIEGAVRQMKEIVLGAPARVRTPGLWTPPVGF